MTVTHHSRAAWVALGLSLACVGCSNADLSLRLFWGDTAPDPFRCDDASDLEQYCAKEVRLRVKSGSSEREVTLDPNADTFPVPRIALDTRVGVSVWLDIVGDDALGSDKHNVLARGVALNVPMERGEDTSVPVFVGQVGRFEIVATLTDEGEQRGVADPGVGTFADGRALIAGGASATSAATDRVFIYDPNDARVTLGPAEAGSDDVRLRALAGLPCPNAAAQVVSIAEGLLLVGGLVDDEALRRDPAGPFAQCGVSAMSDGYMVFFDQSESALDFDTGDRRYLPLTGTNGTQIVVVGGGDLQGADGDGVLVPISASTEVLSGALGDEGSSDLWAAGTVEDVAPRALGTATTLLDGRVLLYGGVLVESNDPRDVEDLSGAPIEIFDFETGQATIVTDDATKYRRGHTATLLSDGSVLVAGGRLPGPNRTPTSQIRVFVPNGVTGTVELAKVASDARVRHQACALPGDNVLLAGGEDLLDVATASAEVVSVDGISARVCPMQHARVGHRIVPLQDGTCLVVGGQDETGTPIADIERFVPPPAGATFIPSLSLCANEGE